MPTPEVIARVRELQAELAETQPDAPHAQVRAELQQAIDAALAEPAQAQHYTSLNDRLLLAKVQFELEHPKLAAAMQATMNALNAAGI